MLRAVDAPPALDAPARRLAALLEGADAPRPDLAFTPLPEAATPRRALGVDGSHAVLGDGRSILVGAWRVAGALLGERRESLGGATRVEVFTEADAGERVRERLAALGVAAPAPALPPAAALDACRTLDEVALALDGLARLGSGDVLLLDGPLAWREWAPPHALVSRLLAEAAARGVSVVGACKSTALTVGVEPVLAHVRRRARREASGTWCVPLPVQPPRALASAYAARLDAAQRWIFRYDVAAAPGTDAARVLGSLAGLAATATYPGYPVPLAHAHNLATIPEAEARDLRASMRTAAARAGLPEEAWDAAFADYHDVLEAGR